MRPLKAFRRLLLQSSAIHAPISGCWVVTLSTPCLCSSTAGGPCTPAAPTAIDAYFWPKGSRVRTDHVSICQKRDVTLNEFVSWILSANLLSWMWSHSYVQCSRGDTHSHTWCLGEDNTIFIATTTSHIRIMLLPALLNKHVWIPEKLALNLKPKLKNNCSKTKHDSKMNLGFSSFQWISDQSVEVVSQTVTSSCYLSKQPRRCYGREHNDKH